MKRLLIALSLAVSLIGAADARSQSVVRAFKRASPCPATGLPGGRCPGWVVDHIEPLCKGGADAVGNLQWQTKADAKAKDRWECR